MKRASAAAVALILGLANGPSARAEEEPSRWYGWQLMLADAAAVGTLAIGAAADSDAIVYVGMGTFVLDGTIVHLAHEQRGRAAISGLLRAGLPFTLGLLAAASCDDEDRDSEGSLDLHFGCLSKVGGAILGGAIVAMVIDYAALSYDARPSRPAGPGISVGIAPGRGGAFTATVGGSF